MRFRYGWAADLLKFVSCKQPDKGADLQGLDRGIGRIVDVMGRAIIPLAASLCLAACTSTATQTVAEPHIDVPSSSIVLLPPGAGAVLGVVETRYVNATEQLISLTTRAKSPSQNYIRVQQFTGVAHSAGPGALQDVPLANLDMAGEARGTVNFADMKESPYFVQNSFGPFGYSMGRTATGDLCMYAWQRVADVKKPGGGVARGAINIRMQYCDAQATEADLLNIMLQLRIRGVASTVIGSPVAIGTTGVIVAPVGAAFPGNVLPTIERSAPSSSRSSGSAPAARSEAAPAAEPSRSIPAPVTSGGNGSTIPSPSNDNTAPSGSGPSVPSPSPSGGSGSGPAIPSPNVRAPGNLLVQPPTSHNGAIDT